MIKYRCNSYMILQDWNTNGGRPALTTESNGSVQIRNQQIKTAGNGSTMAGSPMEKKEVK